MTLPGSPYSTSQSVARSMATRWPLADDLIYRHPGAEIVVRSHCSDSPGDGTPCHEPELLARAQAPEAAVDVDEHGSVFSCGIDVGMLRERGAERHVQAVVERRADVLALPPAESLVAVRRFWQHRRQVVLGVEFFLGREVPVQHHYLFRSLRQSGSLPPAEGAGLSPGPPRPGRPCSRRTALRPRSTSSSDVQFSPT